MQMSRNVVHQGSCPIAACLCRVWIADLQRLSIGPGSGVQSLLGTSLPLILSFMSCIQQRTYALTFPPQPDLYCASFSVSHWRRRRDTRLTLVCRRLKAASAIHCPEYWRRLDALPHTTFHIEDHVLLQAQLNPVRNVNSLRLVAVRAHYHAIYTKYV